MGWLQRTFPTVFGGTIPSGVADSAAKAAGEVFGLKVSKDEAHGLLAGIFPYGLPPKRGTREMMILYSASPWLRAVVGRIADRVASTQWKLYAVRGANRKAMRIPGLTHTLDRDVRNKAWAKIKRKGLTVEEVEDHPMLDFLRAGNLMFDGRTAQQVSHVHYALKGQMFWLIERWASGPLKGKPQRYYPIPPFWIIETPSVSHPGYRMQFLGWNDWVPETEVVEMRDPDPYNPYNRGIGVAESISDELSADENASKLINANFYNMGLPAAIVSMEGNNAKNEAERMSEDWKQKYQGFMKAFRVHFTSSKISVNQLSQSFASQQMLELRQQMRDAILEVYGYPKELLGILTNANRSTIDTAAYREAKYVIEREREKWRHLYQQRLAPEWDERLIVEYESDVPEDKEFILGAMKVRPYAYSNNQFLALTGHEPIEGPDGDARPPMPVAAPEDKEMVPGGGGLGAGKGADPAWVRQLALKAQPISHVITKSHDGSVWVALVLPPAAAAEVVAKYSVGDAEPDDIGPHITLVYLGNKSNFDAGTLDRIKGAVQGAAAQHGPLSFTLTGSGKFTAGPNSDGMTPVYVVPSAVGLAALRTDIARAIEAAGVVLSIRFDFVPHICVGYVDDSDFVPPSVAPGTEWSTDAVSFMVNPSRVDLPLSSGPKSALLPRRKGSEEDDIGKADIQDAIDSVDDADMRDALEALFSRELEKWGSDELKAVGVSAQFDMSNPDVADHIRELAGETIDDITDTTRDALRSALAESYEAGESITDAVDRIQDLTDFGDARAELVARTEVVGSSNFGSLSAYKQSGVVQRKEWLATPGTAGSRESHEEMNGSVIGLDDAWTDAATGATGQHPGGFGDPASDCNCRCAVAPSMGEASGKSAAVKAQHAAIEARRAAWQTKAQAIVRRCLRQQRKAVVASLRG